MKNQFKILENGVTLIICKRYGKNVKVRIATEHLDRAKEFPNTWSIQFDKSSRTHYVYGRMKVDDDIVKIYLHVWLMNPDEGLVVDHINHIGTDNHRGNLRVCSRSENGRNVISNVIFDQSLGLDGLIWNNSRYKGELYWMSVYFQDIFLDRFVDISEATFIRTIALNVYEGATDQQMLNRIVPLGYNTDYIQTEINAVRKTLKMPDPSKLLITQQ